MSKTYEAINSNIPEELFSASPETWRWLLENFLLLHRSIRSGTAVFGGGTTVAVVFDTSMPADDYQITIGAGANKKFWWTAKTVNGFTLNVDFASSDSVDWLVVR